MAWGRKYRMTFSTIACALSKKLLAEGMKLQQKVPYL